MFITAGPSNTRNIAGKMNSTVGKIILIGAFIAFSSAAAWRRRRESAAWTRRMRPSEMPSCSAWTTARTKASSSGASTRVGHVLEGGLAGLADPDLGQQQRELLDERAVHVLGQLRDRAVEAQTGLDADREHVECVR